MWGKSIVLALGLVCPVHGLVAPRTVHDAPIRCQESVCGQEPETPAQRISRALARLRDRRASHEVRDRAMDELMTLGSAGAAVLAAELELELTRLRRQHGKAEARVLARIEKLAPRVVAERLDRAALAEVEAERRKVLAAAADEGLSKATIEQVSDPAYRRLVELLVVSPNQVFDSDEALFVQWAELLDGVEHELVLHTRWEAARAVLAADPAKARSAEVMRPPARPPRDVGGLLAEVARLAELGTPMSERDREVFSENGVVGAALDPEEARGSHVLQRRRVLLGLSAQRIDPKLCDACRAHSRDMVEHGFFAHESPVPGRETPGQRAAEAGTSAFAENIAYGASTGEDTIMQWWYSPGHHRNMLGGGARTGLGRHQNHWTQLFGG
jgi:hypothetical protein